MTLGELLPPELHFAFSQVLALFQAQSSKPEVASELFWASLHGIAELTRTKQIPAQASERAREGPRRALHLPKRGNGTGGERAMTLIGALSDSQATRDEFLIMCLGLVDHLDEKSPGWGN